jgi:CRP-like cAMP-binding protein
VIFEAGDGADCVYVVQRGTVEIRRSGTVIETVGEGGIFGEMAMIDGSTRSADAVAGDDCAVVVIPERQFDFMICQTPQFARVLMTVLAERIRNASQQAT